ncbi:Telomere length regulation protein [Beauveria brongniartii RCEF 3172]|uniref:Telomere length regulation protein n=1 Tax=Beauveria brongniartii RCEF 3172 TaxID=1081107 RepID=A0A166RUL2_9HYPO|nr:Telomere length regulation protein [Beauveria brongniartii RCEF 3172]
MNSISNRIASTQEKARILGMVVGESLSALVDKGKSKLDFHMDEMETEEIESLKSLTGVSNSVGPFEELREASQAVRLAASSTPFQKQTTRPKKKKPVPRTSTVDNLPKAIIEGLNSSDEEDDGLVPYSKGSDPKDSDDDAELVQRNKVKPPVYIRDVITYFQDVENYDKQKLALRTAPTLVRRKANYGTEVRDHAEELAGILGGLQDKFELDGFSETQLEGMVALMVAQPQSMAPWEVAGFDTGTFQFFADFPPKQLPEKIQSLYLEANKDAGM